MSAVRLTDETYQVRRCRCGAALLDPTERRCRICDKVAFEIADQPRERSRDEIAADQAGSRCYGEI